MKKILTFFAGIVFIITILVAGGCSQATADNGAVLAKDDSTKVDIYLKEILIDGIIHLEMYDSKKPDCEVIDNLVTVVYPGYTVTWKKASKSEIDEIKLIRIVEEKGTLFSDGLRVDKGLYVLEISPNAKPDTVKYDIVFTVKGDTTNWTIDPYLRIPDI